LVEQKSKLREEKKMNLELVKQFADISQALKEEGVYGISKDSLHVSASVLKDFEQVQLEARVDSDYYPYEVFIKVEGIKIFCLVTSEGIKEFPQLVKQQKEHLKAELMKRLAYLEEDVILDGMEELA
jgi:hypothetical protein